MAHAYETFATGGKRIWNPKLGAPDRGPVGIHLVRDGDGKVLLSNPQDAQAHAGDPAGRRRPRSRRSCRRSSPTAPARRRAIPGFAAGKTGTTENYGDAWFVGWNEQTDGRDLGRLPRQTRADADAVRRRSRSRAAPIPALLWHNFMIQAMAILDQREAMAEALRNGEDRRP